MQTLPDILPKLALPRHALAAVRARFCRAVQPLRRWLPAKPYWLRMPAFPLPQSRYGVMAAMVLMAVLLRLPFFFTSTDGYMRDAAITFHDEAMFMQQGREVLRGHLPFMEHWDNATPLQWYVNGALMLLSFGTLTGWRIVGALWMAVTAYIVFRTLADRGKRYCAWWAAFFYLAFASTLQVGQSFTFEHVIGLPFSLLVYMLLNPNPPPRAPWKHPARVLGLFGFCCWLSPFFIGMAPAVAILCPALYPRQPRPAGPGMTRLLAAPWRTMQPVLVRCFMLITAGSAGYLFFWFIYLLFGEASYYTASMTEAARYLAGNYMRPFAFFGHYLGKLVDSNQWLIALFVLAFFLRAGLTLLKRPPMTDKLIFQLPLLAAFVLFTIYLRGNNSLLFLFYLIMAMPVVALIMGYAMHFNLADLRWFAMVVTAVGLFHTGKPLLQGYGKLAGQVVSGEAQGSFFYGDRLYRAADIINTFPMKGEDLVVCGEDDMLYLLTGAENPRFLYFPFHSYNWGLHHILDRQFPTLRQIVETRRPLYIVGREGDPLTNRGFGEIGDLLQQRYVQVANIEGTVIYFSKDKLVNIFAK